MQCSKLKSPSQPALDHAHLAVSLTRRTISGDIRLQRELVHARRVTRQRVALRLLCTNGESFAPKPHSSRADSMRLLLALPGIHKGPACYDALSAKLVERAGFPFAFMSGFSVAAARLGAPDTGLISYYEMLEQGRNIMEATKHLPVIGDGDTGYGNVMNVKRTVKGYAAAGFAGILIEDQVWPKSCGHVQNKRVVDRQEAVERIRGAVDARSECGDIVIVARTDARQAESFQEALWRVEAFAEAGADVVFVDALETIEEMKAIGRSAQGVHKMASMLEGGSKTPWCSPADLEDMGFKLVAYPLSLMGVSISAMEKALQGLKHGVVPGPQEMPSFQELQDIIGFTQYFEEEKRYAVRDSSATFASPSNPVASTVPSPSDASTNGSSAAQSSASYDDAGVVCADEIIPLPSRDRDSSAPGSSTSGGGSRTSGGGPSGGPSGGPRAGPASDSVVRTAEVEEMFRRSRFFRIRIEDRITGVVKLETRIPAGFLDGVAAIIPEVSGMKLEDLIRQASGDANWGPEKPILSFSSGGDQVQVFLEQ